MKVGRTGEYVHHPVKRGVQDQQGARVCWKQRENGVTYDTARVSEGDSVYGNEKGADTGDLRQGQQRTQYADANEGSAPGGTPARGVGHAGPDTHTHGNPQGIYQEEMEGMDAPERRVWEERRAAPMSLPSIPKTVESMVPVLAHATYNNVADIGVGSHRIQQPTWARMGYTRVESRTSRRV